jgi:hypothetical protein
MAPVPLTGEWHHAGGGKRRGNPVIPLPAAVPIGLIQATL